MHHIICKSTPPTQITSINPPRSWPQPNNSIKSPALTSKTNPIVPIPRWSRQTYQPIKAYLHIFNDNNSKTRRNESNEDETNKQKKNIYRLVWTLKLVGFPHVIMFSSPIEKKENGGVKNNMLDLAISANMRIHSKFSSLENCDIIDYLMFKHAYIHK